MPDTTLRTRRSAPQRKKKRGGARGFFKALGIGLAVLFFMGILSAAAIVMAPDKTLGTVVRIASNGPAPNSDEILSGKMPEMSSMYDGDGNIMATFYDQRRTEVKSYEMSQNVRNAMVSIEDRRFYEHEGVDWKGIFRALTVNLRSGQVEEGASTLTQQYVKNYTTIISADNEEEAAAATEQTAARKLTEITTAMSISETISREEILTRYLNLVFFGHGAYGIEEASWTYFNIPSSDLNVPQAALLAGMVQGPSLFDPWQNPDGALSRRDDVIAAMLSTGAINQEEADAAWAAPLGVLPSPNARDNGCIGAGNRGFFCEFAVRYLEDAGVSEEQINADGLRIDTTLDPRVQQISDAAVKKYVNPGEPGVAGVMTVLKPGEDSREVRAISASRDYGFADGQTVLPLPTTNNGTGAGSTFKIFTAATALENGVGTDAVMRVPATYESTGLGAGNQPGCNPEHYCVSNVGVYPETMSFKDIMARSPNTPFIAIAESVGNSSIVDMAVRLGMRSYDEGGNDSIASRMQGSGSFTLGPTPVSSVELSNVAATLASGGVWCNPNPIKGVKDHQGEAVDVGSTKCERAVDASTAQQMSYLLSGDSVDGTAAEAARRHGWNAPMAGKTGTTDNNQSAAFVGYVDQLAASTYIFNDGQTQSLCSAPARQCGERGNMFGGNEPADMWFETMSSVFGDAGATTLATDQQATRRRGAAASVVAPEPAPAPAPVGSPAPVPATGGETGAGAGQSPSGARQRAGETEGLQRQQTVSVPGVGNVIVPNGSTPEEVLELFGY